MMIDTIVETKMESLLDQPPVNKYETSWEPQVAERIADAVESGAFPSGRPYMVGMVGIPGSGKTVSAFLMASMLEDRGIQCMVMPHDGYHLPLDHLRLFPNAEEAIYRRGASDTFDPHALKRDLALIRDGDSDIIMVPGFDHARGDPDPDTHAFDRNRHKVVLCEGLYLLHKVEGWEDISSIFDLKIFINSNIDNCIERLKVRNQCIPGYTPEQIIERCEKVDRVNAMAVLGDIDAADVVVQSIVSPQPLGSPALKPRHDRNISDMDALNLINQNDIDHFLDHDTSQQLDWTMDITSRSRSNSLDSRPESVANELPAPPPSSYVGTWEPELAERIRQDMIAKPGRRPYMVALVGTPGSGKSISAFLLANTLEVQGIPCMVMPHDGYHYTLDYLKTFPNAEDFIYRRGAADTIDPHALKRDLDRIRDGPEDRIMLPAFDHARGDPQPDTHAFNRNQHQVVICEGLYLLHDQDGWEDIKSVFDFSIFMNSSIDVCIERVKIRNQCIPGYTFEELMERCEKVDRVNALTVLRSKPRADVIVDSLAMKR